VNSSFEQNQPTERHMTISIGDKIPNLTVATTQNKELKLRELFENDNSKNLVLYFYPKDNTPGCTTEGQDFTAAYKDFKTENTEIIGCSRESIRKHQNFINKYEFAFDLISDPEEELCKRMDVMKQKSMYGKTYIGIERSTFIFDTNGRLVHEIRKVKVKGHVDEVLSLVKSL